MPLIQRNKFCHLLLKVVLLSSIVSFNSCLTPKKMDVFVADQYNNQLPAEKKKKTNIAVASASPSPSNNISVTTPQSKVLPLVVYWYVDHRFNCSLNSQIGVVNFSNNINVLANRGLNQKLNGQKLELTVEQMPSAFALVDKYHAIWLLLYVIHWDKVYIQPDFKDLVVSYKLYQGDTTAKTGKITVKNTEKNKGLRLFQSWKSATSEYLTDYDTDVSNMTKVFVDQLTKEL